MLTLAIAIVLVPLAAVLATNTTPQLGLDLEGGVSVVLAPKAGTNVKSDTLGQAVSIIRNRVDSLGVAEPDVSRQGNNIIVDLPGVKDQQRAIDIVGQTAELRFRPVLGTLPPEASDVATTTTAPGATTPTSAGATPTTAAAGASTSTTAQKGEVVDAQATTTSAPATTTTAKAGTAATTATTAPATTPTTQNLAEVPSTPDTPGQNVILPIRKGTDNGGNRLSLGPELMTGKDVKTADARYESGTGWDVHLSFTGDGFKKFNDLAAKYVGKQVAIVLDGVVQSYPVIKDATFTTNDVVISGNFKESEAKSLALVLRYGALPVALERQTVQEVSPSLGKDQLRSGIFAGLLGLALVALYMLVYYRLLGMVIWAGLLMSAGALYALTCWLGSAIGLTLTVSNSGGVH